jgi:Sulfatase-modifying factor enzyme 1
MQKTHALKISMRVVAGLGALALAQPAWSASSMCPPDSVRVGSSCVDTYEASVWQIPAAKNTLIQKVQSGTATLADLISAGATQINGSSSCVSGSSFPSTFPANGNWTEPLYAVSIPGVNPTECITWFQAEQACALSGKRLLTNQEWQQAATGTPDPGTDNGSTDCNIQTAGASVNTGSRSNCKSTWGAFDMVGNANEWVADWVPRRTVCPGWGTFSDDSMCLAGASEVTGPGALYRGGYWDDGSLAGVFHVDTDSPAKAIATGGVPFGFRCGAPLAQVIKGNTAPAFSLGSLVTIVVALNVLGWQMLRRRKAHAS